MEKRKIRVLVVEDDQACRTVARECLKHLGYEVETANNGEEALKLLGCPEGPSQFDADVIILDLLMPVMDGFEFLRTYDGPVPIIVYSGWVEIKELNCEPFAKFIKPESYSLISETIKLAFESWRQ